MINWPDQMLLLNVLLPPMILFSAIWLTFAAHPDPLAARWFTLFPFACYFPLFVTWAWKDRHV